jgi:hypothetical protein
VPVKVSVGLLTISAVYLQPKYTVNQAQLGDVYNNLGCRFIAERHLKGKHTYWGSRLITHKDAIYSKRWKATIWDTCMGQPTKGPSNRYKGCSPSLRCCKFMFWHIVRTFACHDHTNSTPTLRFPHFLDSRIGSLVEMKL